MSAIFVLCDDFKQHLKIQNHILTKKSEEKKFKITIYCKQDDINIKKELDYVNFLFLKHNLMELGFHPFQVAEIISIRRDYFSTFIFCSDRKQ